MSDPDEEPDRIRWYGKSRFTRKCREGDAIIRIWTSHNAKRPSTVMRSAPVLLKQQGTRRTYFLLGTLNGSPAELSWGKFQKLLAKAGRWQRTGEYSRARSGNRDLLPWLPLMARQIVMNDALSIGFLAKQFDLAIPLVGQSAEDIDAWESISAPISAYMYDNPEDLLRERISIFALICSMC
jgi:hypothetical protein